MNIELDQYERDNLLALLSAVAGVFGTSPMSAANNGDWNWTLIYKLGYEGPKTDYGHPNVFAQDIVARARMYLIKEEPEWTD